jgi:SWI/SNF-related matrix-associated actin-dependent regulator of chromatin subfamily A3
LEDIGNLFAFIQAYPFDKIGMFRRFIALPFDNSRNRDVASKHLGRLIDSVCLRRSRGLLNLPSQNEYLRPLELSNAERAQYEKTKRQMSRRLQQGPIAESKDNTFGQFHVQLQLRILCNHGTFQNPFSWMHRDLQAEREDLFYLRSGQRGKNMKCSLCKQFMPYLSTNQIYRTFTRDCAHVLCDQCLEEQFEDVGGMNRQASAQCPICRPLWTSAPSLERLTPTSQAGSDAYFAPTGKSAKMEALVKDLLNELHNTRRQVEIP